MMKTLSRFPVRTFPIASLALAVAVLSGCGQEATAPSESTPSKPALAAQTRVETVAPAEPESKTVSDEQAQKRAERIKQQVTLTLADDIWPEERFFFRSDHFHFARKGVPALFFFSGVHEDYHQPSDELERLDTDKVARISRMIFHLVRDIADADERPEWEEEGWAEVRALVGG